VLRKQTRLAEHLIFFTTKVNFYNSTIAQIRVTHASYHAL
jgi:hypothetical protein